MWPPLKVIVCAAIHSQLGLDMRQQQQYTLEPANYHDYRDFLKIRFEELKQAKSSFSLQACAKRSGISKALLQFLLSKKRHVGLDKLPGLAKAFKMSPEEESFVYMLACKNSSKNPQIVEHFEQILARMRNRHIKTDVESLPENPNISENHYNDSLFMILQSMVNLEAFQEDPQWILDNLKIKNLAKDKVVATLKELESNKTLTRNSEGRLVTTSGGMHRPDPYDPKGQKVYQRIALSVAELLEHPEMYRPSVYMGMALSMDEENLAKAEKFMIEVHHQLNAFAKASHKKTAVVYSGNFLMAVARLPKPN